MVRRLRASINGSGEVPVRGPIIGLSTAVATDLRSEDQFCLLAGVGP